MYKTLIKCGYSKDENKKPKPNQIKGITWLYNKMKSETTNGAILADSLGSGKTMQILSLLCLDKYKREVVDKTKHMCSLIIVKSGFVNQWCGEINKFFSKTKLKVIKYNSNKFERLWDSKNWIVSTNTKSKYYKNYPTLEFFEEADIIITQYSKLLTLYNYFKIDDQLKLNNKKKKKKSSNNKTYSINNTDNNNIDKENVCNNSNIITEIPWIKSNFAYNTKVKGSKFTYDITSKSIPEFLKYNFRHLIIDEGHEIRSASSKKNYMLYAFISDYNWALTATPTYHKDIDVWALLYFIKYKTLPSRSYFEKTISTIDINNKQSHLTQWFSKIFEECIRQTNNNNNKSTQVVTTKKVTRKRKLITQVPTFTDKLSKKQKVIKRRFPKSKILKFDREVNWNEFKESNLTDNKDQCKDVKLFVRDQWIPYFEFEYEHNAYKKAKKNFLTRNKSKNSSALTLIHSFNNMRYIANDAIDIYHNDEEFNLEAYPRTTTKMGYVLDYINNPKIINSTDKILIFCERVSSCEHITNMLNEKTNMNPIMFSGKDSPQIREEKLKEFQSNPHQRILVSTFCSESSLNLQCINHIIFVSRWWVKSRYKQCIGRCFRMGQKKDVFVTFLSIDIPIERHLKKISNESGRLCAKTIKQFCDNIK